VPTCEFQDHVPHTILLDGEYRAISRQGPRAPQAFPQGRLCSENPSHLLTTDAVVGYVTRDHALHEARDILLVFRKTVIATQTGGNLRRMLGEWFIQEDLGRNVIQCVCNTAAVRAAALPEIAVVSQAFHFLTVPDLAKRGFSMMADAFGLHGSLAPVGLLDSARGCRKESEPRTSGPFSPICRCRNG
jgi:hypothetical protein